MKTFRRLIVPVDGSAASIRGVAFAAELARSEHAEVHLCSAIDEAAVMVPIAEGSVINPLQVIEALEAAVAKNLAAAMMVMHAASVVADSTLLQGSPVAEIDAFVRRQDADAIVMGTTSRSRMQRAMMGSVTMGLLCSTDVPVIAVHADDPLEQGPLLVAIDASSGSMAALECAIDRAGAIGTTLQLLHVFEESNIERLSAAIGLQPQNARRHALTRAEDALDDAADRVRAAGITCTTEIIVGSAAEAILTAAERHGAAAIAIGTHGRGALERFFIGSVAAEVIRQARRPIYVVHRRHPKRANTAGFGVVDVRQTVTR